MTKKVTAVVSYFTIVGWLIAYFAGDREGASYQLNQSLVWNILSMVINAIFTAPTQIPLLGILAGIAAGLVNIPILIIWIFGFVYALNEEDKPLPLIGWIQLLK